MLSLTDAARLLTLTSKDEYTPDEADYIKHHVKANCYLYDGKCKWAYPLDENNIPTKDAIWYIKPVRAISQGGCSPNPKSLSALAPWEEAGVSRSYWYIMKAQKEKHEGILQLFASTDVKSSLKLYTALNAFWIANELDYADLQCVVGWAVRQVVNKEKGVYWTIGEGDTLVPGKG